MHNDDGDHDDVHKIDTTKSGIITEMAVVTWSNAFGSFVRLLYMRCLQSRAESIRLLRTTHAMHVSQLNSKSETSSRCPCVKSRRPSTLHIRRHCIYSILIPMNGGRRANVCVLCRSRCMNTENISMNILYV